MSADILSVLVRGTLAMSAAILVVLALRHSLRAAFGAQLAYAFWALAPLTLFGAFLPARLVFVDPATTPATPVDLVAAPIGNAGPVLHPVETPGVIQLPDLAPWLLALWIAGAGFAIAAHVAGHRRFLRSVDSAGPAVVGILRPRIVLPADFDLRFTAKERELVLAHERAHLAACDAQINAFAALLQCLTWFNPLIHIACAALRVDQELACDARVMSRHAAARRTYAEAMLKTQLSAHALPLGCQWPPIGPGPLKQRISMLARPAPGAARQGAGAALCALATLAAAGAAWIMQPPRIAYASQLQDTTAGRALGARLVAALKEAHTEEARDLIEAGANVNYFVPGDGTPLVIAAQIGEAGLARELIARGADVNMSAPGDGNPLIVAAAHGDMELVRLFIEQGADVNAFVRGDETPLINAARENRLDVAAYLIQRGANVSLEVEAPTLEGLRRRSPLSEARRRGHVQMVALLTEHGAHR